MKCSFTAFFVASAVLALAAPDAMHAQACSTNPPRRTDWPVYGGQAEGDHYSPLSQINQGNVQRLKEAWKFDAAEAGGLETSPIIVGRTLFAYTASQKVIALDAATGKLLWKSIGGAQQSAGSRACLLE
jgi:quinoprotein glucose dehydrogenase